MGPSGQEDPEGSGAGSSPPLEGDVLWGKSPGDSWGGGAERRPCSLNSSSALWIVACAKGRFCSPPA